MDLMRKLQNNYLKNKWWLRIFTQVKGPQYLATKGFTPQAIGIWCNPYTSNSERIKIWRMFKKLRKNSG